MVDGVGSRPDGTGGRRVVAPRHTLAVEKVGERRMFEARILGRLGRFAAAGIDHRHGFRRRSEASGGTVTELGIFGGEQGAGRAWEPKCRR